MVAPALDEYLIKETRDPKTGRCQVWPHSMQLLLSTHNAMLVQTWAETRELPYLKPYQFDGSHPLNNYYISYAPEIG